MNQKPSNPFDSLSRRGFLKTSAAGMAAALAGQGVVFAGSAPRKFRVALIGCGGRGNGALGDCHEAAKVLGVELEVVATADWFKGKAEDTGQRYGVPASRCFGGAEGYKRVLEANPEVVLMATSPNFRPVHLMAAVQAGKHVFMEKPVAVDPPGGRKVIEAGRLAKQKGLAIVAGTQRRHQGSYLRIHHQVAQGAIGSIAGGAVWWCGGALWYQTRRPDESDADYMVRNWVSFTEMSGDHIVEQHVHNIDVANWYLGRTPSSALGFGGRARRRTGNQFDFFSIDFDYGDGCRIHSMCRQINGCDGDVREFFKGTEGETWGDGGLKTSKEISVPDFPNRGPYVQEHVDLLRSIMDEKPINEAENVATSTLTAIMGRISAYTGKLVRWRDIMEVEESPYYSLTLKPTAEDFETGEVVAPPDDVAAVPGSERRSRG
ncbi:MAG: Gfo/Idh/MocA family oxidoreductase [Sedimentisphaerales bacterium]|nr:Gfo/Idh/MocA family oxidoreductase [Sedimentisphaerales bacterium]